MSIRNISTKYSRLSLPAKAGFWFTICSIIQRGISVISMPIFTRLFSTSEYGEYSLYTSWSMLFSLVVTLNLSSEVFNKGLIDHESEKTEYTVSQLGLISALVGSFYLVYLVFHNVVDTITGMNLALTSLMYLEIYSTAVVGLWYARKRFNYEYRQLIIVTLGISFSSVIVGIVAVSYASTPWKVIARVASNVFPFFVVAFFVAVGFLSKSRAICSIKWWSESVRLGVPLVPHYASQVLLNQADKMLIAWFLNSAKVAIYGIAHSAGLLLTMVNNGINSAFVPWLYKRLERNDFNSIGVIANALSSIVLALVFLLMLFAPECVSILATEKYQEAIWSIPPIATGVVFAFLYTLFVNVEIYYGETKSVAIASIAAAAINLILNWVAIPLFGYIASAYITSACYLATAVFHYIFMQRALRRHNIRSNIYDIRFLVVLSILTLGCSGLSVILYTIPIVRHVAIGIMLIGLLAFRNRMGGLVTSIKREG